MKRDRYYNLIALAHSIVLYAVEDWRALCNGQECDGVTFDSLRSFFKSEWCLMLCGEVNPLYILRKLEQEREKQNIGGSHKWEIGIM